MFSFSEKKMEVLKVIASLLLSVEVRFRILYIQQEMGLYNNILKLIDRW